MKKTLISIFFVLFTIGCSNISTTKYDVTNQEKLSLITLIGDIKSDLQAGDTQLFQESLVPSIRNSIVKTEITNIDFSQINIITSKPVFNKNTAKNVVAFVIGGNTLYFDVEYLLKNGKWKISEFKERRG